ncbi:MAG: succinyl-diaminopimelate desuccinylase [Pseudomonadota bacterium]
MIDPIELTQDLVRAESVTPDAGKALDIVERELTSLGATAERLIFSADGTPSVDNLFARIGTGEPHLAFAGHVDVVPTGPIASWTHEPFSADIKDGFLYGRGATDMKSGVACFLAATAKFLSQTEEFPGSISFVITGDEEGPAINGTEKLISWMVERGHRPDHCIVGEPASAEMVGDRIRVGRRGSISGSLTVTGKQGHTAYPERARSAVHDLSRIIAGITQIPIDNGAPNFSASNIEFTRITTSNTATNVIPGDAEASFNIRFNPSQSRDSLFALLSERASKAAPGATFDIKLDERFAAPFIALDEAFLELVDGTLTGVTGNKPERSTGGGTSDARFIAPHCPTVEIGLCAKTMHEIDERVPIADLSRLTGLYLAFLEAYFGQTPDVR